MGDKKWEIRNKKLLLISYFLLLIFIVACGRRGDPVAITPYEVGVNSKGVKPDSYGEVGVVKDFPVIAETVTSVFNDKNIEPSKNYYYKVSAVGNHESLHSEEIEIVAKSH
ncbi:MAG: hypothetical protein L0956_04385 [Candidatus Mariimomonas ferrooxydans]